MKTILSRQEKLVLAKVKTTKADAKLIIKRNKTLLDFLERDIKELKNTTKGIASYQFNTGCPHCKNAGSCNGAYHCSDCNWTVTKIKPRFSCCHATFGGVSAFQCIIHLTQPGVSINLSCNGESLEIFFPNNQNKLEVELFEKSVKDIRTFLLGHIEWANLVISGKI